MRRVSTERQGPVARRATVLSSDEAAWFSHPTSGCRLASLRCQARPERDRQTWRGVSRTLSHRRGPEDEAVAGQSDRGVRPGTWVSRCPDSRAARGYSDDDEVPTATWLRTHDGTVGGAGLGRPWQSGPSSPQLVLRHEAGPCGESAAACRRSAPSIGHLTGPNSPERDRGTTRPPRLGRPRSYAADRWRPGGGGVRPSHPRNAGLVSGVVSALTSASTEWKVTGSLRRRTDRLWLESPSGAQRRRTSPDRRSGPIPTRSAVVGSEAQGFFPPPICPAGLRASSPVRHRRRCGPPGSSGRDLRAVVVR